MIHSKQFLELVTTIRKSIKETDVLTIHNRIKAGDNFILVDVREESEWKNGHLPNAIHIGKGVIERDIETKIPNNETKIVLYCGGGFRSILAADNLKKMCYSNVISMDGGFRGWKDAGFEIVKD